MIFNYACGGTPKIQDFYFLKDLIYLHNFNCSFLINNTFGYVTNK